MGVGVWCGVCVWGGGGRGSTLIIAIFTLHAGNETMLGWR